MTHTKAILDGRLVSLASARLPVNIDGLLYGAGSFTTIPVRNAAPFLANWHHQRLVGGAVALGLGELDLSELRLRKTIQDLCRANRVRSGLARISVVRGATGLWQSARSARPYHWWGMLKPPRPAARPARIRLSSWPVLSSSPLAGFKLHHYTDSILAMREAHATGFDEAVRLNEEGEIAGACHAALLWRKGRKLYHASPDCGGVLSTTLTWATRELRERGTPAEPGGFPFTRLRAADEIVLLSAGVGVRAVSACPGARLAGGRGELFRWLSGRYREALASVR